MLSSHSVGKLNWHAVIPNGAKIFRDKAEATRTRMPPSDWPDCPYDKSGPPHNPAQLWGIVALGKCLALRYWYLSGTAETAT